MKIRFPSGGTREKHKLIRNIDRSKKDSPTPDLYQDLKVTSKILSFLILNVYAAFTYCFFIFQALVVYFLHNVSISLLRKSVPT
jgi:hypothetical protein